MKTLLTHLAQSRLFWLAVFIICACLEGGALYFQHVLGVNEDGQKVFYQPCELCIYTRVWLALIAIVAIIGMITCKAKWLRRAVLSIQTLLVIGLSNEVYSLLKVEYQFGDGGSCKFRANFYDWMPLDQWFPNVFEVKDMCQATPAVFGSFTMVHGLTLVCGLLLSVFVISAFQEWQKSKS
ncbi:disulfide bond formation protein B [Marinicellulosiphila megalodicopiae]|uniref:disulfide bond formation protein B n=1 Tax=Marinicellulosiphila megalodicopiae TaxID=2724896 RepID=UPI003BB02132